MAAKQHLAPDYSLQLLLRFPICFPNSSLLSHSGLDQESQCYLFQFIEISTMSAGRQAFAEMSD